MLFLPYRFHSDGDTTAIGKEVSELLQQDCSDRAGSVLMDAVCDDESRQVIIILLSLCALISIIFCLFTFLREDKDEQITPLCPQLIVKEEILKFRLSIDSQEPSIELTNEKGVAICKVAVEWPDPFRNVSSGVAATVRVKNNGGLTLATVIARNVAVAGQGIALCRAGCEIFGFVEPDGPRRYIVRHRTNVTLLSLMGDFSARGADIDGANPAGTVVFKAKIDAESGVLSGHVVQHVDAGLVVCSVLATQVHKRLTSNTLMPPIVNYGTLEAKGLAALTSIAMTDIEKVQTATGTPQHDVEEALSALPTA